MERMMRFGNKQKKAFRSRSTYDVLSKEKLVHSP